MWDGSALVFQLFSLAYFSTVPDGAAARAVGHPQAMPTLGLGTIAVVWSIWCLFIGTVTFFALPSKALLDTIRAAEGSPAEPLTQDEDVRLSGGDGDGDGSGDVGGDSEHVGGDSRLTNGDTKLKAEASAAAAAAAAAGGNPSSATGSTASASTSRGSFLDHFCRTDTRLLLLFMSLFNLKSSFYIGTRLTAGGGCQGWGLQHTPRTRAFIP